MAEETTDRALVAAFLEAMENMSGREIAVRVPGVTPDDVSRWRRDEWSWLSGKKRRTLLRFVESHRAEREGLSAAEDVFGSLDRVTRYLGGIGGPPEEAKLRKLDALEGLRRFVTASGEPLPQWWWTLKRRVERDEL